MKKSPLNSKRKNALQRRKSLSTGNSSLCKNNSLKREKGLSKQAVKSADRWQIVRKQCVIRDNGICQICGEPGTEVHHIHLRSKRQDLKYVLSNLILLCKKHHFHQGSMNYQEQTQLIANKKGITVEQLLLEAEGKTIHD